MIKRDLLKVLSIEEDSEKFRWGRSDFLYCLQHQQDYTCLTAETKEDRIEDRKIVGFIIGKLLKSSIHLVNFAVHPDWWRQSIGTQMIKKLIDRLSKEKRETMFAEVPETNLPVQLLLRKCGFKATNVLRGHYRDRDTLEDVYIMEYDCKEPSSEIKKQDLITRVLNGLLGTNY